MLQDVRVGVERRGGEAARDVRDEGEGRHTQPADRYPLPYCQDIQDSKRIAGTGSQVKHGRAFLVPCKN